MSESHAHLLALIHRWLASSRAPAPAPSLAWRQTYGPDEVGAAFIENYGWAELFGAADWRQGDAIWRKHPPGTLIHHCSEEIHAMRTADEPLLALYLWQSGRLSQKARLEPTDGARPVAAPPGAARPGAARQTGAGGRP